MKEPLNLTCLLAILFLGLNASAQIPISPESYQLQQLVQTSRQQLNSIKELLENGRHDSELLEKSAHSLKQLSSGLDRSVEKFRGTAIYEQALLKMQSEDLAIKNSNEREADLNQLKRRFERFQSESIKANLSDLTDQQKISESLRSAEPGFVSKLETQSQLGQWQATTRVSAQLTELLAAVRGLREDLRANGGAGGGLAQILAGAEMQNQKQRETMSHGNR